MKFRHFGEYLEYLARHGADLALTTRLFLKTERHSFSELSLRVHQTAWYLRSLGIKPGDRIMIVAINSPEWVMLFLGAQLIGAVVVPVDARSNAEAAHDYAAQTDPAVIFKNARLVPELARDYRVESIERLPGLIEQFPTSVPDVTLTGSETAVIVFTSGTTAAPKGVVLTQRNVLANIFGVAEIVKIPPHWAALSVLPLSHMFELTASLTALAYGASIAYLPRITPLTIAKGFKEYQPTVMFVVPELLSVLQARIRQTAEASGKGKLLAYLFKLSAHMPFRLRRILFASVHREFGGRLQAVVCGGAPVAAATAAAWETMGVCVVQGYDLTETSPILTVNSLTDRRLDSQGMVLPNIQLRIAPRDGETQAKGPSVFHEYWHNPTETKQAFTTDGWFKTGDIGRIDDGWLHIQGRAKFMIVLASGLKVFPEDIELAAYGDTTFKELCVVGKKGAEGETVEAVVVSEADDVTVDEAIARTNTKLQPFQHITGWRRWPEQQFPRNRILKVDRKTVQAWLNESAGLEKASAASGDAADPLAECIRLSVDKPGLVVRTTDRLGDLGLDSLRRLNLVSLIEEQLGHVIEETAITSTTTVRQLQTLVAKSTAKKPAEALYPSWPFSPFVRCLGNVVRDTLVSALTSIWVRQRTVGTEHLPRSERPVLYMFNHTDNLDGPVAYRALPRHIRRRLAVAQAADFMREHRATAWGARFGFAAFDFARQAPFLPSLEYTARLVDKGWSIAMFPEGSIARTPRLRKFKSGIGLLAVELGIPVVPVKIDGLFGTLPLHAKWPAKRSHVTVHIGKPVTFAPGTSYDEATHRLETIMHGL